MINAKIKEDWVHFIKMLQDKICTALELEDGAVRFQEDQWKRPEGGGGRSRIISNGKVFEKGGVNISEVFGEVTEPMRKQLAIEGRNWFAAGLSLVLHPKNPFVPTVHANYRYFELYNEKNEIEDRWFGGGTDLTPYYLIEEDATHFHQTYKKICDQYDLGFYPQFKKNCDQYFVNQHRNNERRGIGGIFYDYQRPDIDKQDSFWMAFAKDCGEGFLSAYIPIVQKRKMILFSDEQKYWQEIRRGRYVEFNLIHDRGTIFGLKTNGRVESILMSLPPTVRFDYNHHPEEGSPEYDLLQTCLFPREWV